MLPLPLLLALSVLAGLASLMEACSAGEDGWHSCSGAGRTGCAGCLPGQPAPQVPCRATLQASGLCSGALSGREAGRAGGGKSPSLRGHVKYN